MGPRRQTCFLLVLESTLAGPSASKTSLTWLHWLSSQAIRSSPACRLLGDFTDIFLLRVWLLLPQAAANSSVASVFRALYIFGAQSPIVCRSKFTGPVSQPATSALSPSTSSPHFVSWIAMLNASPDVMAPLLRPRDDSAHSAEPVGGVVMSVVLSMVSATILASFLSISSISPKAFSAPNSRVKCREA